VPDIDAQRAGVRRFVGRRTELPQTPDAGYMFAFVPTGESVSIPAYIEYVRCVQQGDLWPADEDTAKYCNVAFDPHFGAGGEDK
jgi:hypothetical protein